MNKSFRALAALSLAFLPVFGVLESAHAACVSSYEAQTISAAIEGTDGITTLETCGGDDSSYQIPLTTTVSFDGVEYDQVYVTTNSVITFGAPDGTYWDYPQTPSISLYSMDWVVYPNARSDEHLIIQTSDGGFQVDIALRPIWNQNVEEVTNINITAAINYDGTVAISYVITGPEYEGQTRTGVRLVNGDVVSFEDYGIEQVDEPVELTPEPVVEPEPTPEPTQEPTVEPTVEPTPYLNSPSNLRVQQLPDGNVELIWDAPEDSGLEVERYAVSWQNENGGWGVASLETNIYLSSDLFEQTGGLDSSYTFSVRSDNDTQGVYSSVSDQVEVFVATPYVPEPVPQSEIVLSEGNSRIVLAPENQQFSGVIAWYGDPNDYSCGADVSEIVNALSTGQTEVLLESNNGIFGDPCGGIVKALFVTFSYEDLPAPEPVVTEEPLPTPEPEVTQTPEPQPTFTPTPEPIATQEPVAPPEPQPTQEPEPVVSETPSPTPSPTETIQPSPSPTPAPSETLAPAEQEQKPPTPTPSSTAVATPSPTVTETPKPSPSQTSPAPTPSPTPTETPKPLEDDKPVAIISVKPDEVVSDLLKIDLDKESIAPEQIEEVRNAVEQLFSEIEKGSEEYGQALEALAIIAEADDAELPEELAAIPVLGAVAGEVLNVLNDLGNIGADMSPEQREKSEETVVAAVIVGQVAQLATATAASAGVSAAATTRRIK